MSSLPSSSFLEQLLQDLYIRMLWRKRLNVHMSDLDEPRRSMYDRMYPVKPSMATILNFVRGESSHSFFRDVLGQLPEAKVEKGRVDVTDAGTKLTSHPDVAFLKSEQWPDGIVWEFKSTLGKGPKKVWVKRTHRYMAVNDVNLGVLAIHYLLRNEIKCYPMQLTSDRLSILKSDVCFLADAFESGLATESNVFPKCTNCRYIWQKCPHLKLCSKDGIKVGC